MLRNPSAALLALLLASVSVAGCGEVVHRYDRVKAASGRVWNLIGVMKMQLKDGRPAVMVSYETALAIQLGDQVRAEAEAVLEDFRDRIEAHGTDAVVISAQTPEFSSDKFGGWVHMSDTRQFLIERHEGEWKLVSEKTVRIPL